VVMFMGHSLIKMATLDFLGTKAERLATIMVQSVKNQEQRDIIIPTPIVNFKISFLQPIRIFWWVVFFVDAKGLEPLT
jgi:hypothetical protein